MLNREPVVVLALVAIITEAGGAVSLLATNHTTEGILVAAGTFLTGLGGALARSLVSPLKPPETAQGAVITEREHF